MKTDEEYVEEFEKKFPHKIAEVIDDFGSTVKNDIKDHFRTILKAKDAEREKAVEALRDIASITPEDCERWGWYETVNRIVARATEALTPQEVNSNN